MSQPETSGRVMDELSVYGTSRFGLQLRHHGILSLLAVFMRVQINAADLSTECFRNTSSSLIPATNPWTMIWFST